MLFTLKFYLFPILIMGIYEYIEWRRKIRKVLFTLASDAIRKTRLYEDADDDDQCLQVIWERANVTVMNEKYMNSAKVNIRRYSRKSPYYLNIYADIKHQWGNNITVDIVFNQYLHNEYRRSFIEYHLKFCDFINDEPYMGRMLKLAGLECPVKAGPHAFMNMTAPTNNFPNVFPFEKGRVDAGLYITRTKEPMFVFVIECSFKK